MASQAKKILQNDTSKIILSNQNEHKERKGDHWNSLKQNISKLAFEEHETMQHTNTSIHSYLA